MTEEQGKMIDFLESLPARRLIVFDEGMPSDDYFTAVGRLKKSLTTPKQGPTLPLDSVSGTLPIPEGLTKVQYTLDLINKNLNQKQKLEIVEWLERRVR